MEARGQHFLGCCAACWVLGTRTTDDWGENEELGGSLRRLTSTCTASRRSCYLWLQVTVRRKARKSKDDNDGDSDGLVLAIEDSDLRSLADRGGGHLKCNKQPGSNLRGTSTFAHTGSRHLFLPHPAARPMQRQRPSPDRALYKAGEGRSGLAIKAALEPCTGQARARVPSICGHEARSAWGDGDCEQLVCSWCSVYLSEWTQLPLMVCTLEGWLSSQKDCVQETRCPNAGTLGSRGPA